jgi:hypothetical protein
MPEGMPDQSSLKPTLNKQQAQRHLIHAAVRLMAAREGPLAVQLLVQSADKLQIDIASRTGKKLAFQLDALIKPEYKAQVRRRERQLFNFLKHADLVEINLLALGACVLNYHALYGAWTDHMKVILTLVRLVFPQGFYDEEGLPSFTSAAVGFSERTPTEYFQGLWEEGDIARIFPNLIDERNDDIEDTFAFYDTNISALRS